MNKQKAIEDRINYYTKVSDNIALIEDALDGFEFLDEILPPLRGIYENFIRDLKNIANLEESANHHDMSEVMRCDYCGRTEICEGSYPEGCFLDNKLAEKRSNA